MFELIWCINEICLNILLTIQKDTMANLLEKSVIGLLDVIGSVYELIVFVPYYFLCKPYKKMERSRRIKVCEYYLYIYIYDVYYIPVVWSCFTSTIVLIKATNIVSSYRYFKC